LAIEIAVGSLSIPTTRLAPERFCHLKKVFVRFKPMHFRCSAPQIHREDSAGDEARTRDVHLGKVVLYQLSYTRSFERDNNVQPTAPRNLLIAPECAKSLNPNHTFAASYDQTLYE
jgi:hypothetical protein